MAEYNPAVTSVAASVTAVTLFAADPAGLRNAMNRMIHNDSTATLYIKYGASASTSDYSVKIPADGYFEFPAPAYDGLVTGAWAAATGNAHCTEVS